MVQARRMWAKTFADLASATAIPRTTLTTWRDAGKLPPKTRRGWNVKKTIALWENSQEEEAADAPPDAPGFEGPALERWRLAKAEREELELAKRKGELLETETVRESLRSMVNVFASGLRSLESHALEDSRLEGEDLKLFAGRIGARIDELIVTLNQNLAEIEVRK